MSFEVIENIMTPVSTAVDDNSDYVEMNYSLGNRSNLVQTGVDANNYMEINYSSGNRTSLLMEEKHNFEFDNYSIPPPAKQFERPTSPTTDTTTPLGIESKPTLVPSRLSVVSSVRPSVAGNTPLSNNKPYVMGSVIDELKSVFSLGEPPSVPTQQTYVRQYKDRYGRMGNINASVNTDINATSKIGTAKAIANPYHNDIRYAEKISRCVGKTNASDNTDSAMMAKTVANPSYNDLRYTETTTNYVSPAARDLNELRRMLNKLVVDVQSQNKKIEDIWRTCGFGDNRSNTIVRSPPWCTDTLSSSARPLASHQASKFPQSFTMKYAVNEKTKENLLKNRRVSFDRVEDQTVPLTTSQQAQIMKPGRSPPMPRRRLLSVRRFLFCC